VAGTLVYAPPAGTVLAAGTYSLTATFTPADTVAYTSATATVTLVVNAGGGGAFVGPQNGGGWSGQIVAGQLVYRGVSYPLVNGTVTLPDCRTYLVAPTGALFGGTPATGCPPASTSVITTVAGTGTSGFGGDGGAATAAQLDAPEGVAVDGAGNLYIADNRNHRIRKLAAATGVITTVVGTAPAGFSGDGGLATAAQLDHPTGSAVDGLGNLYIADNWNHRIRKVTAATGIITTVAGTGTGGFGGDGGASTAAQLYYPYSVAVDGVGNLYIADYYNQRIRKVTAATGIITTVAGTDVGGFSGDGGAATAAQLLYPNGVAVDGAGNLYIADTSNQRVRKVTAATGIITTVAGTGTYGFNGDGGAATAAQLRYPSGLAVDGAGNLYIADWENHRVRLVASATGVITTVAGAGTAAFGGDGAAATLGGLSFPASVAVDNAKTLYIADSGNHRIRKVAPPSAAAISSHPSDQSVSAGSAATFSVAASGYPPPSLQWQVSTNGGLTWTDLAASSPYSGVTSRTLTVAEAPFSLNGYQYRAVATNGVGTATSRTATLVVNAGGGGAFVGPQNGGGWSGQIVAGQLVYRGVSYPLVNGTVTLPDCRTYIVAPTGALFGGTLVPGCTPGGGAGPGTPVITWATPAAITAGSALSATELNATANVAGTLVYAPPAGTVLAAGTYSLTATFTPADTVAYTSATATVTLVVNAGGGGAFVGPQNGGGWSGQIVAGQLVYRGVSYPLVNGTVTLPDCRTYIVAPTGALFGGTLVPGCTPGSP
jgi:sugar lactone lactonase YvrE